MSPSSPPGDILIHHPRFSLSNPQTGPISFLLEANARKNRGPESEKLTLLAFPTRETERIGGDIPVASLTLALVAVVGIRTDGITVTLVGLFTLGED